MYDNLTIHDALSDKSLLQTHKGGNDFVCKYKGEFFARFAEWVTHLFGLSVCQLHIWYDVYREWLTALDRSADFDD